MIIKSCYDTTAMYGFPTDKVNKILRTAIAAGATIPFDSKWNYNISMPKLEDSYVVADEKNQYFDDLPALKHPYVMVDEKTHRSSIIIDARTMLIQDKVNLDFILRGGSRVDYRMLLTRASLLRMWLDDRQIEMRSMSSVPATIFARWIGSTLMQRYMLDPREQETIEIISAYYYYNLFTASADKDVDKVAGYMSRNQGLNAERTYEVLALLKGEITDVGGLCDAFAEVTGSIRLQAFNAGHLFTALGMGYFGMIGKELTAIALEHPPTWIAMLMYAVDDAMFRKSTIGTMMERGPMHQKSKDFYHAALSMIHTYAS